MQIRLFTQADLKDVARVHALAFPRSGLTQFGPEALRRYYSWQLNGPHDAVCLGAFEAGRLEGFCFAGVFKGAETGFLNKNRSFLIWRLVTHPWLAGNEIVRDRISYSILALRQLARKQRLQAKTKKTSLPRFGILSIAVDPQCRRGGVGRLLMAEAEQAARRRGFSSMRLSVHTDNEPAIRFYEQLGWVKTLRDETWQGVMEKDLQGQANV